MHRFYCVKDGDDIRLRREDERHALRVLRLKPGDGIEAVLESERWGAKIVSVSDGVRIELVERLRNTEPEVDITLFQGLPKAEKMEWIIQKCTELGVARFCPVLMERSIPVVDKKSASRKLERWRLIAEEAVKQCGGARIPEVMEPAPLEDQMERFQSLDSFLVPWEAAEAGASLSVADALKPAEKSRKLSVGILIGPEGGITGAEMEWLSRNAGAQPVSLGPRILRTETAAMTATVLALSACGGLR